MKKYKLAVFDMDGTILDTLTDIANAVNYSLTACNLPERTIDEVRSFVGNGLHKLVERAVPENCSAETVERVYEILIPYYGEHSNEFTRPYEGINDTIREMRKHGIKTAVVSNKANFAVLKLVEDFFEGLFDFAIGEHDGFAPKPAPDMIDRIFEEFAIEKKDSVYIGDSDVDLLTAKNSGMDCIAVSWGFRSREFLEAHGAEIIIDKPIDLMNFFI